MKHIVTGDDKEQEANESHNEESSSKEKKQ